MSKSGCVGLGIFLTLVLCSFSTRAQISSESELRQFLATDYHKTLVTRAAASLQRDVFERCPTLKAASSTVTMTKRLSLDDHGVPKAGAWDEHIPVSGCGNDTVLNFFFSVGPDSKVATVIGVPGTSHANPTLQKDTLLYANSGAAARAKTCRSFHVRNTKFEAYGSKNPPKPDPGAEDKFRPWWETWTLIGCGRSFEVPITFQPDATGTSIIQPLTDVVER